MNKKTGAQVECFWEKAGGLCEHLFCQKSMAVVKRLLQSVKMSLRNLSLKRRKMPIRGDNWGRLAQMVRAPALHQFIKVAKNGAYNPN